MSINLDKNQRELISSWKEVVDEKRNISWAVYGYEKQSNCLELVAKGDDLEELADQFSISRIMYAFCRYKSVNSDLPKFFIINWQGEGAPPARKMACANHINDVAKFFRGSNMTIEARNEDDVEPTSIIKKLERISIHSFNLKERSIVENVSPVGTNYKRIQPQKEIDIHKRETFWSKVQEEENKRRLEEKKRLDEERLAREKILVERQLDEAQEEKITIITEDKRELSTDNDIKKELERSKSGVRGKADNQWIKVKDEEKGDSIASNGTINGETVKCTNLVKSRVESFKKAFEGGKPPSLPKKTFLDIKKIKNDTVTSKTLKNSEENSKVTGQGVSNEKMAVNSSSGQVAPESLGQLETKKELDNGIGKDVTREEIVKVAETINETQTAASNSVEAKAVENHIKAATLDNNQSAKIEAVKTAVEAIPKVNHPTESVEMLNEEAKVPASPSPEPGLEQLDDANEREGHLNAEIYETEEELNDKQSEDILNAEELEDEEYDVNKSIEWTSNSRVFPAGDLEPDENQYFTVKSSYLDTLEDIAEEAEENIEEEEDGKENGETAEDGEKEEDELEYERRFLEEIEKKFPKSEYGLRARALYDYQAADETEITFDPDDIITHIEQVDVGWWQGMAPDGTYGLFPANYVQLIE